MNNIVLKRLFFGVNGKILCGMKNGENLRILLFNSCCICYEWLF